MNLLERVLGELVPGLDIVLVEAFAPLFKERENLIDGACAVLLGENVANHDETVLLEESLVLCFL